MNLQESINYAIFYTESKLEQFMDEGEDDKFIALYEEWREFYTQDQYVFFYILDSFGKQNV